MSECTCPEHVEEDRRVYLYEPGAVVQQGGKVVKDASKIHIFDKDCPVHGWTENAE